MYSNEQPSPTNTTKQTFPNQLNLVCTSFRLHTRKATFTNQKNKPSPTSKPPCTSQSFRLVHQHGSHQPTQKKTNLHRPAKPRMYKFPTCTPAATFTNQKNKPSPTAKPPYVQVSDLYTTDKLHQPTQTQNDIICGINSFVIYNRLIGQHKALSLQTTKPQTPPQQSYGKEKFVVVRC